MAQVTRSKGTHAKRTSRDEAGMDPEQKLEIASVADLTNRSDGTTHQYPDNRARTLDTAPEAEDENPDETEVYGDAGRSGGGKTGEKGVEVEKVIAPSTQRSK
jgi:hypothetical protein